MFESAGTLTIVERASSLVALVLLPLAWALVAALETLGARGRRERGDESGSRLAERAVIALAGGTLVLAVVHAVRAARLPVGHVAEQHVMQLARIGQLDLAIDLVRSPTSASLGVLVSFLALAAVLHVVWTSKHVASQLVWIGLATGATLLVVFADDLPALAVGLQIATIAGWGIAGAGRVRPLGLGLASDSTVVLAAWLLFWSLGGAFGTSGFTPDALPKLGLVAVPDGAGVDGKATVSLTTYDDARVSSDEGPPLPGEPIRAPFTLSLDPGTYSFRVQAGAATSDLLVTHVTLAAGRAYVLTPFGPTTSLRSLRDQLAVPRPTLAGPAPLRAVLDARTIDGLHVSVVLGMIVVLAALLRLGLLVRAERGGLAYALEGVAPVVLVMRVAPAIDAPVAAMVAIVPALTAVVLAASAAGSRSRGDVPRTILAALIALALSSVLLGETAGAMTLLISATLGAAAVSAALEARGDVRWLGVSCAGLAGVLPLAGASSGVTALITGAFGASQAGHGGGGIVAPLAIVALILGGLALFRMYSASIAKAYPPGTARGATALAVVLAVLSLLTGVTLGAGSSPFGGHAPPIARRLVVGPGGLDGVPRLAIAALVLSLAAAVVGLVAARRATRTNDAPAWVHALGVPVDLLSKGAGAIASTVRFFVRAVAVMDEDVIDDATQVVAVGVARVGDGIRRVDAMVAQSFVARALGRGAGSVVIAAGLDDPRRFERVTLGLVVGMMVILGLVVLSSVVLG